MKLLKLENVQILNDASDWKDAIRRSTSLLEEHGDVEPRYKEEIISNVERLGPYILIAEDIALPHARPEQGVIRPQIGVTLFRNAVRFSNGAMVRLFVTLAAKDSDSHIDALTEISELLGEEANVAKIIAAPDVETLYSYFGA
jgi:PTS system ascorbate-specific IIA component